MLTLCRFSYSHLLINMQMCLCKPTCRVEYSKADDRYPWLNPCRSDAIYSAMYDGSGLIEVLRGHEYLSHPFAVTMYGGEVYWTDWRTNTLAKANKWTGHNVTVVQRTNTQPFDLQVYHPSRQPQGTLDTNASL